MTMPTHRLRDANGLPKHLRAFVLFETGSATRRVIDSFFDSPRRFAARVVMDTENVEILKAMVKTGWASGTTVSGHRARGPRQEIPRGDSKGTNRGRGRRDEAQLKSASPSFTRGRRTIVFPRAFLIASHAVRFYASAQSLS